MIPVDINSRNHDQFSHRNNIRCDSIIMWRILLWALLIILSIVLFWNWGREHYNATFEDSMRSKYRGYLKDPMGYTVEDYKLERNLLTEQPFDS